MNSNAIITEDIISERTKKTDYPIRGRIHLRAAELKLELQKGVKKSFDSVIHLNIGDCHAFGQKPLTFVRQTLTLCLNPALIDSGNFPDDVRELARRILNGCAGGAIGAYTEITGIEPVRRDIAKYIGERDGFDCDFTTICCTTGATDGINALFKFLQPNPNEKPTGIMIPVPSYSAYDSYIHSTGSYKIGYYQDEEKNWGFDSVELERAYNEAIGKCTPRILCVINPGNPTGNVLSEKNIQEIIKFAFQKRLLILADEVYQVNIYNDEMKFHSFRKVAHEMGSPYSEMEIASLHSASKGYLGECGVRAGYIELLNFSKDMVKMFYKFVCIQSCSPVLGQATLSALCSLPKENEPSYPLYKKESDEIHKSLKEKTQLVTKLFNSIEGITCSPVDGALYAFPKIDIPLRAIEHAKKLNMQPDEFYCLELIENTGICVVPGSGFGQKPGTYHFRATAIVQMDKMQQVAAKFEEFHKKFIQTWK